MAHQPPTSPWEGFSKLSRGQRQEQLARFARLSPQELNLLSGESTQGFSLDQAEHMIENVVGLFSLPIGVATHFWIDGKDVAIPMAVEETSIVAAASSAAKWVRRNGGFKTRALGRLIIGQIQFPSLKNPALFTQTVQIHRMKLIDHGNEFIPSLIQRGGGIQDIEVRLLQRPDQETMAVLHILCDPCDAMGANLMNQICESMKPMLEELTQERIGLCILSNLVDTKLVEATCEINDITPELGEAIAEATLFAKMDPYRGATHNKGVMNGVDPILIATGNDWRAVEAGIHAYVAKDGSYGTITDWTYSDGKLRGKFLAPIAVGTVGGITRVHSSAQICLKILAVEHSEDLARICAAAGLAQNLAALRALCSEGIVQGHMRLHASNLAIAAGAQKEEFSRLEAMLRSEPRITVSRARELLEQMRTAATLA